MGEAGGYFSFAQRDTHHWDVSNGQYRMFRIRGEPGSVFVSDERRPLGSQPRPWVQFKNISTAFAWIIDELTYSPVRTPRTTPPMSDPTKPPAAPESTPAQESGEPVAHAPQYPWREGYPDKTAPDGTTRYRKKTLIEARQWFANGHCPVWAQSAVVEHGDHFTIATREGQLRGVPGDWIARGVEGEVYPIGAEIFAKTYEPAAPSPPSQPEAASAGVRETPRERLAARIAAQDAARGRPLTATEKLDNLRTSLLEIDEAERLSDKDKDSIRARIATDLAELNARDHWPGTLNYEMKVGAIGALTSLRDAIEPWLAHRFDDAALSQTPGQSTQDSVSPSKEKGQAG